MEITFKGKPLQINGHFPQQGETVADFTLATQELADVPLSSFKEKLILLSIFPSIDTPVCSESVRVFNMKAAALKDTKVLCISKDLPFAQARFCGAEDIKNVQTLSAFRNQEFAKQCGVEIAGGPVKGLLARAVIVINAQRKVLYSELVAEMTNQPNYDQCLAAMAKLI